MKTPVVIIFFNRIEPLKKLVARLAEVKPSKVYLVSDGARSSKVGEAVQVEECREFMQKLPWECEIKCNFAPENMGCRCRVTSGLDWVFEQEERAIILEDDCIPVVEYFSWTEKMLDQYCDDKKIMSICGTNYRDSLSSQEYDVTCTKYPVFTGWATWRRAWKLNDANLSRLDEAKKTHHLRKWLGSMREEYYWLYLLSHVGSSWGYRWSFTNFMNGGLQLLPQKNLIDNVGINCGPATHTSDYSHEFPIADSDWRYAGRLPDVITSNERLDSWFADMFYSKSLIGRIKWLAKKVSRKLKGI